MDTEGTRRSEAESFARILRGLSRSVSPDAIVDAIVEELGVGTGADHVAVVRRRPDTHNLECILSPTRAGAPASRTTLPLRELDDPALDRAAADARGRRVARTPPHGDPDRARRGRRPAARAAGTRRAPGDAADRVARRAGARGGGRRRARRDAGAARPPD